MPQEQGWGYLPRQTSNPKHHKDGSALGWDPVRSASKGFSRVLIKGKYSYIHVWLNLA